MKKFNTKLDRFQSELWHFHIPIPVEVSTFFLKKNNKRVICKLNDEIEFHCALMSKGDGTYFINVNKEIRTKLKLEPGTKVTAELQADESKYGMPMPEELKELLLIDDEGSEHFHQLTPGKQRSLIYIVSKPKNSDTRINKALVIVDYLKSTNGKLDFKDLNIAFKQSKE